MSKLDMDRMDDEKDSRAAKIMCACLGCARMKCTKKSDTQACYPECLHNGIILIVYILQICFCKGSDSLFK